MKPRFVSFVLLSLLASAVPLHAGSRSGGPYAVPADEVNGGGSSATNAGFPAYSNQGSLGGIGGVSAAGSPARIAKHSFQGQIYDITALEVTPTPGTLNEGATSQLSAKLIADDATTLALTPASMTWSIPSGPLSDITTGGLAAAGAVYEDTPASAMGTFGTLSDSAALNILNTDPDNFGAYAGDGLDDAWQYEYFGLDNTLAGPGVDADGDGQINRLEYIAGVVPTDAGSLLRFRIEPLPGQPAQKNLVFSPLVEGRSYQVECRNTPAAGEWLVLTGVPQNDSGDVRTVTDPAATDARKFYRLSVTFP